MRIAIATLVCLLGSSLAMAMPLTHAAPRTPYAPGEVVVVLAPGANLGAGTGALRARDVGLAAALANYGLTHVDDLQSATPAAQRTAEVLRLRSEQPGFDPIAVAAALRAQPGVLGAAPNLNLRLHTTPNDPWMASQWHLSNSAAGIHAQQGWARETGAASVLIAIMDTGVDLEHLDLVSKIWTNPGEIVGNGVDDEHDGYQDDVHGWDFGDGDNDPNPDPIIDPASGIDEGWHGTFVAGLAAAATNNGVGIAGVAWNCKVLPLKVTDYYGNLPLSAVASAFDYAIAHHVAVINMSFGTSDPSAASIFQPLVNRAVTAGIVCVASAGNDGTDTPMYPAACDSVLAVASTNASNLRSSWSNWGWYVDIAAPGEGMVSTIARNYQYDAWSLYCFQQYYGFDGMHAYMSNDGTSFAAPVVAGAAALLRSHYPRLSAQQIMQQLVIDGDVKLYDNPIGPKVDIDRALTYPLAVEPDGAGTALAFAPVAPNPAAGAATLRFTLARPGRVRLAIYDAAGREVRLLTDGARPAGGQSERWDLRAANGRAVAAGLYFARLDAAGASLTRRLAVIR